MVCENCQQEHNGSYGSGRFCSSKCARGFSTKNKRSLINEKVSKKMSNRKLSKEHKRKISINNGSHRLEVRKKISESVTSSWTESARKNLSDKLTGRIISNETCKKLSKIGKQRCSSLEERQRLRDIGRKGGFGKKGYTINGIYYQSSLERKCFEYLDDLNIIYEAHKNIPNSSKISDIYLNDLEIWIELDGINREKKKEWLGDLYNNWIEKLKIYESENLEYKVIYNFNDFKKFINSSIV